LRQLCGTVLAMEAIIIGLAILPAIVLEHADRPLAGGIGGALAVCACCSARWWAAGQGLAAGGRYRAAGRGHRAGIVVPAMYVLGVIFTALWFTGIWLARHHETRRAAAQNRLPVSPRPGSRLTRLLERRWPAPASLRSRRLRASRA